MLQDVRILPVGSTLDSIGLVCYVTNSMEQSSPWESDSSSAIQEFPGILWKFTTAFTRPLHMSVSCARSVRSVTHSYFLKLYFNIIVPSTSTFSEWIVSFSFPHRTLYACSFATIRVTCPAHLTILDLITRIIYREQYRLWNSSLYSTVLVTSSLLRARYLNDRTGLTVLKSNLL